MTLSHDEGSRQAPVGQGDKVLEGVNSMDVGLLLDLRERFDLPRREIRLAEAGRSPFPCVLNPPFDFG